MVKALDGKTTIVTGAAKGLGRAFATELAASGSQVLLVDLDDDVRHVATELNRGGAESAAAVGSVSDYDFCQSLVPTCLERFGRLNATINNAGLIHEAPFFADTAEDMRRIVEVNVLGAMYVGAAVGAHMKSNGGGTILNIGSTGAFGWPNHAAYAGTKGAIASLTYTWALEGHEFGIRVNALAPFASTQMTSSPLLHEVYPEAPDPASIAPMAAYLIGDGSAGISGQVFRFSAKDLAVIAHAKIKDPVITRETWSDADLIEAVNDQLADHFEPVGPQQWITPRARPE